MDKLTFRQMWSSEIDRLMTSSKLITFAVILIACYAVSFVEENITRDVYVYITLFAIFGNPAITAYIGYKKQDKS